MRASDLSRLVALKARREEAALLRLRHSTQLRAAAERDRETAARRVAEGETARARSEAEIYRALRSGAPMGLGARLEHRTRLDRLSAAVETARAEVAEAGQRADLLGETCDADRRVHAEAARAASRARRIESLVLAAREAEAERAAEIEQEDDVVMRRSGGREEP